MADLNTQVYNAQHPLVSVVMPAYNAEAFIAQSIESVISQTFTNWELLVVDDGSTDDTKEIVQRFCCKDARIKYYYQRNGKQGKARNTALKQAQGDFIAFLDADDIWLPQKLGVQVKDIQEKRVDLLFANGFTFTDEIPDYANTEYTGIGYLQGKSGVCSLLEKNKIATLTVFAKAEIFKSVNGFTEREEIPIAEDYHLWLKLLISGYSFYGSGDILAGYRTRPDSITHSNKISIPKIIEVLEDLKINYKSYEKVIARYQKLYFIHNHHLYNNWPEKQYRNLIKKNCYYTSKRYYNFIFQVFYKYFGLQFTRRVINKVLNNNTRVNVC